MVRQLGEIVRVTWESVSLAVRVPDDEALAADARAELDHWSAVEPFVVERYGVDEAGRCRPIHRGAVLSTDRLFEESQQIVNRLVLLVGGLGTVAFVAGAVGLIRTSPVPAVPASVAFAVAFVVVVLVILWDVPYIRHPWRRIALASVVPMFGAAALSGVAGGSPVPVLDGSAVAGVALGLLVAAAFGVYGLVLASIFLPIASSMATRHYSGEIYEHDKAIRAAFALVADLGEGDALRTDAGRTHVSVLLLTVAGHLDDLADRPRTRREPTDRFRGASAYLHELDTWVDLPQRGTRETLRDAAGRIAAVLVSGYLHDLPHRAASTTAATQEPARAGRRGSDTRTLRGENVRMLVAALLPISVYVVWSVVGPGLPAQITQWVGAACVLWLVVRLVEALDPGAVRAWHQVRELLPLSRDRAVGEAGDTVRRAEM